jgi:Acetylglutamate kinase
MLAAALRAETLILLTAVPGLLAEFPDESTLIRGLSRAELPAALEMAQGRIKKKVLGAQEALQGGANRVIIADGRCNQPITAALDGSGTLIQ